jgi:DNA-binding winged helix-turn-helix (wHTH) protein
MLSDPADLQFGSFRMSLRERRLLQNGQEVPLTPKAFDTLQFLITNAGHLVEKQDLMKAVWGDVFVDENTLNQNIFTIRKALGDASFIENVPRRGYRFAAAVTTPEPIPQPASGSLAGPNRIGPGGKIGFSWITAVAVVAAVAIAAWVYAARPPGNPLDGATYKRFTNFEGDELNGAISPDGKFVAFVSDRNGSFDNWLGEATGSPVVWSKGGTRESSRNLVRSLGFSADGSVWNKELTGGIPNWGPLRITPLTGGAATLFLEQEAMEPAWSADGKRVVYHTNDAGDSMFVADGTGANPKKFSGDGDAGIHRHLPAWSRMAPGSISRGAILRRRNGTSGGFPRAAAPRSGSRGTTPSLLTRIRSTRVRFCTWHAMKTDWDHGCGLWMSKPRSIAESAPARTNTSRCRQPRMDAVWLPPLPNQPQA